MTVILSCSMCYSLDTHTHIALFSYIRVQSTYFAFLCSLRSRTIVFNKTEAKSTTEKKKKIYERRAKVKRRQKCEKRSAFINRLHERCIKATSYRISTHKQRQLQRTKYGKKKETNNTLRTPSDTRLWCWSRIMWNVSETIWDRHR